MSGARAPRLTRERIKQTAMGLVVERGVEGVSVRDIAAAVGMKPSNLYAHFASKAELIDEMFAEGYAEYGRLLADEAARDAPFAIRLEAMVRLMCDLHDADRTRFRFLLLVQHDALGRFEYDEANPVNILSRLIRGAIATGEIPPGDGMLITAMIVGVVVQAATFQLYGRMDGGMIPLAPDLARACVRLAVRDGAGGRA
ncbi:MAG TPA: TetR/AcrR family transcriptional regulator [Acetobacteraceae bacterium]|jgi:AcrR family transcriptional regulator